LQARLVEACEYSFKSDKKVAFADPRTPFLYNLLTGVSLSPKILAAVGNNGNYGHNSGRPLRLPTAIPDELSLKKP
jgi:hypothetical protein